MPSSRSGSVLYQERLAKLADFAREIKIERLAIGAEVTESIVTSKLRPLLSDVLEVLLSLEDAARDAVAGGETRRRWSSEAQQVLSPLKFEELGDLTFMVATECRAANRPLTLFEAGVDGSEFGMLAFCEELLAKVVGGLSCVEAALAQLMGRPSLIAHHSLHSRALGARRLIAYFRQRSTTVRNRHEEVRDRLRALSSTLGWLRRHDDFRNLRASDRFVALQLQQRIVAWLRNANVDERTGTRLEHEFVALATLLAQINRQGELIEHDRALVLGTLGQLRSAPAQRPIQPSTVASLGALRGRDEILDHLLESDANTGQVLDQLLLLAKQLDVSEAKNGSELEVTPELEQPLTFGDLQALASTEVHPPEGGPQTENEAQVGPAFSLDQSNDVGKRQNRRRA